MSRKVAVLASAAVVAAGNIAARLGYETSAMNLPLTAARMKDWSIVRSMHFRKEDGEASHSTGDQICFTAYGPGQNPDENIHPSCGSIVSEQLSREVLCLPLYPELPRDTLLRIADEEPTIRALLDRVALAEARAREPEAATFADDDDAVRLVTMHASKGLAFRVVILPDEGISTRGSGRTATAAATGV